MPNFILTLSERGRVNWVKILAEYGIKPGEIRQNPIDLEAQIEPIEEIDKLLRIPAGFLKGGE